MNLRKLYRNPEVKKITVRFLCILVIGIIFISIFSKYICNVINKKIINQNIVILSNIIDNKDLDDIVKNFLKESSEDKINEARNLLKSYGYDEDLPIEYNEVIIDLYKYELILFMPTFIILILILYIFYVRELRSIYIKLEEASSCVKSMSNGDYKNISGYLAEGDIGILITSLNYMGERVNNSIHLLKEEKQYLKDFLSDISHQLKTPLASLIMFNDLLRENENMPHEDRVKFLDSCDEQLNRMEWLILNLLKVGRLEAGVINFQLEEQELSETIELALSPLKGEAQKKNQKLIFTGELNAVVNHDREWLAEALSNIIKNAIEHTQEYGSIEVNVQKGPIITKIYIKDNGEGISKEMQEKIFKRFYKGEGSRNPKSIGIGLSLSKSIIEKQGGEIKLISEEGKGSTFIISFMKGLS